MGLLTKTLDRALGRMSGVKEKTPVPTYPYGLHHPLLYFNRVPFSVGDSLEHVISMGSTGSGKTTGVMATLLGAYLWHGYGGLVCTVKSDDTQRVLELCAANGRLDHVIMVNPQSPWRFNFLNYEFERQGAGGGQVENAVATFMEVIENRADGGRRQQGNPFFTEGARRLLRHSMEMLRLAGERVSMENLQNIMHSMPTPTQDGRVVSPPDSYLVTCMGRAEQAGHNVRHLHSYFWGEMGRPGSSRQTAGIISTFTNSADPFLSGHVQKLFASEEPSNWSPDVTRYGRILLLDMPISEYGDVGRSAQILIKKIWIDAMLRRQGLPQGELPCFLLCDEYQSLATPSDAKLMQAGRSSWVAALALTQNLNNLYASFEPMRAQHQAHAMLGNFSTLIGCRNHDKATNEWFADTIGKNVVIRRNRSTSQGESSQSGGNTGYTSGHSSSHQGGSWSHSSSGGYSWNTGESYTASGSINETFDYPVPPGIFTQLAVGNGQVQTIVFKAGKKFPPHGAPYTGQVFRQR